ncbi:MAG: hypothetical protein QXZ48_08835 [Zestosphaera sp.]
MTSISEVVSVVGASGLNCLRLSNTTGVSLQDALKYEASKFRRSS